jgi:peptidoglycan/LPS O-acetylase OafA/YrhL
VSERFPILSSSASAKGVATVSQRFKELDALRGLAACAVVLQHFLLVFPQTSAFFYGVYRGPYQSLINRLADSPIHIIFAGNEAVIFFFLLSGFVLSLPFYSGKKVHYSSFLVKRVCRIYIPYAIAITIAIAAEVCLSPHGIYGLTSWFNNVWTAHLSWQLVLNHYLLLGSFSNTRLDPVIWSLVQEMRISIIFPLLMLIFLQFDWQFALASAVVLYYIVGYQLDPLIGGKLHLPPNDMLITPSYMGIFLAGAIIARQRSAIIQFYQSLPKLGHYLIFATGIALYTYRWTFYNISSIYIDPINRNAIICAGASLILITVLSSARLSRFLQKQPLVFLGKISYSTYLYHILVLTAFVHILYGKLPFFAILGLAFVSIFPVAIIAHYLFEEPSMRLGRYLTGRKAVPGSSQKERAMVA